MRKILIVYLTIVGFLSFGFVTMGAVKAETINKSNAKEAVRQVVNDMNQAITKRDNQALFATFAEGAVKLDLYRPHAYNKTFEPGKVVDLKQRWQAVTSILFTSTRVYERKVKDMQVHLDDGLATVWATIATRTEYQKPNTEIKTNQYSEVYLLRLVGDAWKIVAMTNNRQDTRPVSKRK